MKVRTLLPIAVFLLGSCNHGAKIVKPQPSHAPKPMVVAPAKLSFTHFNSFQSAMENILNDNIRIIAFGEIHKNEASNLTSTLQHFSRKVMPLLAKHEITDLVLEHLPSGEKAKTEIENFGNSQKLGPFLADWFAFHSDYCGVIEAMKQAHRLGIDLHGSNAAGEEEYNANLTRMGELINERTLEIVRMLLKQKGKRFAVYGGATHNDISPPAEKKDRNFGNILSRELGKGYVEVDIYLPDLVPTISDQSLLGLEEWQSLAPKKGANVVRVNGQRFIIILPPSNDPIVEQIPPAAPACP